LARLDDQATDLTLRIVRQLLQSVGGNVGLDNAVSPPLIRFSIRTQLKMRVFCSEQKEKLQWLEHSPLDGSFMELSSGRFPT
jgi:hypothetical protein